ncbi:MAG: ABC transporter permease, partial [Longimicrobiales bacterium]
MGALRTFLGRLRAALRRGGRAHEIDDEFRFHLDMETEAGLRRGLAPETARNAAYRSFGGVERFREEVRDERRVRLVDELGQDVRYAVRVLVKNPLFSFVAIATLALGIGANTAIFSVVNAVLLRPLPFPEPDRLVMVWETDRASETSHEPASLPDIRDFQEQSRTLASLGGFVATAPILTTADGEAELVDALAVDDEVLAVLGVRPLLGRTFTPEEAAPGGERVVLLSESFWRDRYDADAGILGRTLTLDGEPRTVIGVLPRAADLGIAQVHAQADYASPFGGHAQLWLPLNAGAEQLPRQTHPLLTVGRLAPGASLATAQRELAGVAADLEAQYPENDSRGVNLEGYGDVVFGPVRPALMVLLGAVGLVLLITCANVANLLLVRTTGRAREV